MHSRSLLAGLLILLPTFAFAAATSPPGVNLRWDQCYADGGAMNKSFACNTNVGTDRLAMSFELASPLAGVVQVVMHVALGSASPSLPAWWQVAISGCRPTALSYNTLAPVGSANCPDWAGSGAVGGIGSYISWYTGSPNSMLVTAIAAVAAGRDLVPGVEYSLGTIGIGHSRTVGSGACSGCDTPVCILFSDVEIGPGPQGEAVRITQGANWSGSPIARWQNAYLTGTHPSGYDSAGLFFPGAVTQCVPYSTTSSRPSTWGAVKSLYR